MTDIKVTPLGAGQDVGRSCILLSMGGKNIMLDCGMHMGFNDDRRFPDFSYVAREGRLTDRINCLIISHFHLDHCGALPYMSEMVGYDGPIYMTHPTKAICPILLEDYRKINVERNGAENFFTSEMIKTCMKKVITVNLHQVIQVDEDLEIKAYYAGHVLGAAMFHIRVGENSVVYTGDYNMTPDRHLGSAWIDKCRPDLLITESTYATTIRDSKRCRERDFLKKVHDCVDKGGKVLIPVFALGRAQELCILLESYWDRMNLKVPIYFSTGLTEKANHYYKLYITWTSEKIKKTFVERNLFEFKHIRPWDRAYIDNPGPMVVFATPGMLHAGLSLQIFKRWAPNELNMVIMPGYCVAGTVGHRILNGARKIEFENKQTLDVRMSVEYMSFSAHADAKGIMLLIDQCCPRNVLLVHGEAQKMAFLKNKIQKQFGINCYMPANGETSAIATHHNIPLDTALNLLKRQNVPADGDDDPNPKHPKILHGALMMKGSSMQLRETSSAFKELDLEEHELRFTCQLTLSLAGSPTSATQRLYSRLQREFPSCPVTCSGAGTSITVGDSVHLEISGDAEGSKDILLSWKHEDEDIGSRIQAILKTL